MVNYVHHCIGIFVSCPLSWSTQIALEKLPLELKLAIISLNAVIKVSEIFFGGETPAEIFNN